MKKRKVPNPKFSYSGDQVHNTISAESTLKLGEESTMEFLTSSKGIASNVEDLSDEAVKRYSISYDQIKSDPNAPEFAFQSNFEQNGVEWEMIFRITSDDIGYLIGSDFALEIVDTNYPEINMGIHRTAINQAAFGVLKKAVLPSDYEATLVTKFWSNGKQYNQEGWIELEVSYVKDDSDDTESIPKVTIGSSKLYPGHAN